MKKIISIAALSLAVASNAYAGDDHSYFKFEAGAGIAHSFKSENYDGKRPDAAPVYGIGFGRHIDHVFSVDGTVYRFQEFDFGENLASAAGARATQEVSSTLLAFNVNAEVPKMSVFTPFVTVGVGVAANEAGDYRQGTTTSFGQTRYDISWNVGVGTEIDTGMPFDVLLSYKYFDLGEVKTQGVANTGGAITGATPVKTDLRSHTFLAGLKYEF